MGEHATVERLTHTNVPYACDWCGQKPRRLYEYSHLPDRMFCNKDCARGYDDWPRDWSGDLPISTGQ